MTTYPAENFRRPRCRLLVSGNVIDGCHSIELSTSNLGQAGSFFVQLASGGGQTSTGSVWSDEDTIDVSIQLGFLPLGMPEGALSWQEMMSGRVDRLCLDPVSGTMTLEGRDYAARLLDMPVTESFLNCTSSEVAQQLADRCGLSTSINQTVSMVGQYYQIEHARTSLSRFSRFGTAWDLLSNLAQLEQFDLWVEGTTLHFQAASSAGSTLRHIDFRPGDRDNASPTLNVTRLSVQRSLAMAGGVPVSVSSWNSRQRKRVVARSGDASNSLAAAINVVRPNLLPDTAQILADGVYGQTSGHERTLSATMPGDLVLSPRDALLVTGIGTSWDGYYRVDSVDREMTLSSGFTQRFTAKTVSD